VGDMLVQMIYLEIFIALGIDISVHINL